MLPVLVAVLITIPAIGLSVQAEPRQEPANLVFVGSFDRLDELQAWDAVTLTADDAAEQTYVVAWSRLYPTDELPGEVTDGPASGGTVVTLITTAPFSDDVGYPQQRVVRAVPLP